MYLSPHFVTISPLAYIPAGEFPGIYFYHNALNEIIYIGHSTYSVPARLTDHFNHNWGRGPGNPVVASAVLQNLATGPNVSKFCLHHIIKFYK